MKKTRTFHVSLHVKKPRAGALGSSLDRLPLEYLLNAGPLDGFGLISTGGHPIKIVVITTCYQDIPTSCFFYGQFFYRLLIGSVKVFSKTQVWYR